MGNIISSSKKNNPNVVFSKELLALQDIIDNLVDTDNDSFKDDIYNFLSPDVCSVYTLAFENELKNYVGTDYCLTLNSGTSALHATYLAYGFGQGDNIILPSFTFIATANSTLFVNAKPNVSDRLFKFFLPVSVHSRFPTVNNSGFIFIISFI